MKKHKILSIIVFSIAQVFNVSCDSIGGDATELGNGYVYRVDGSLRWIRGNSVMKDGIYPNVIDFKFDNNWILALQEPTIDGYKQFLTQDLLYRYQEIVYETDSSEFNNYERKFLQSYLWTDSLIHTNVMKEIKPNNQTDFEKIYPIADSIVHSNPKFKANFVRRQNYWIIDKRAEIIFGPYSKQQYNKQRKRLDVPINLQLDEE